MRFIARLPIVRRVPTLVVLIAAVFALAACDGGPSSDDLRRDLTTQLENDVAPGLLSIEQLTPLQESTFASLDRERRRVRFTADLKLKRDHDFGAWDQLNALAFLQALGARAEDAQGIKHDAREGWDSWEVIHVNMPEAEMRDLITEIRSITQGIGTFDTHFSHYQELVGRDADKIVQTRKHQIGATPAQH